MNTPRTISEYLEQLRRALAGADPAMIQDAQWKDTFIEKVRENVRTLELSRAWRGS